MARRGFGFSINFSSPELGNLQTILPWAIGSTETANYCASKPKHPEKQQWQPKDTELALCELSQCSGPATMPLASRLSRDGRPLYLRNQEPQGKSIEHIYQPLLTNSQRAVPWGCRQQVYKRPRIRAPLKLPLHTYLSRHEP